MARRVTTIPATGRRFTASSLAVAARRRVAAYARVSTEQEEQLTSYEAQVDYYTGYIQSREDWDFVAVYTDEGITGCNTKRREGFKRMVADALEGKIDLIITKSVSRFARNTVDSLTAIRQLKDKGVECFFEKENIWTFDGKGELLLTIMSSLAQEEARSISENVTWGQRKRFADGKYSLAYSRFLGYDKGEDGGLVINEKQAQTVRLIFRLFLEGYTPHGIAKELTQRKILTPGGVEKWSPSTVSSILTNEKYKGDALLQKSYIADFLTKKQVANRGEIQQYYVENDHPAIIQPEVFDAVQQEMLNRRNSQGRYSGVDCLAAKLRCGQCGGSYGPKVWHSNSHYRRVVYQCNGKYKHGCTTPHLDEQQIKALFVAAVNRLLAEKNEVIANLRIVQATLCDVGELEQERQRLCGEMSALVGMMESRIAENARIAQDQEAYQRRYNALSTQYEAAKERLSTVQDAISDRTARGVSIGQFIKTLEQQDGVVTEFDGALWSVLLDHAEIFENGKVRFCFKNGITI